MDTRPESAPSVEPLLGLGTLDRLSPIPLYFQVAQHLERAIESGRLPPGTQLDNEMDLSEQLGLSRPTVRRAMQYLVDKGLIVRRRGIGTRVVQPKVRRPLELSSLYDDLATSGQDPRSEVLSLGPATPAAEVASALGLGETDQVLEVVRLRHAGGRPLAWMHNYLPTSIPLVVERLTREALEADGLYRLLRTLGVRLHTATQTVGARTASAQEARLLGEPRGAALLTMQRIAYDDHGRPAEFGTHLYAASRYSFEITLLTT
jgi:DNA-binding GntR family transcriptional regulator